KLNCPEPPLQYKWEFGDGDESTVAEPIHVYSRPGTYRVEVTIRYTGGREYRRTLDVTAR
ncbi:MAG: PKD domain-containing protein, partial [Phycisphaerae bacterium]